MRLNNSNRNCCDDFCSIRRSVRVYDRAMGGGLLDGVAMNDIVDRLEKAAPEFGIGSQTYYLCKEAIEEIKALRSQIDMARQKVIEQDRFEALNAEISISRRQIT